MHTNFIHIKTKSRNLISEATAARHKPARTFKRKSHWNFASRTFVNTKQRRAIKNKKYLTLLNCCCHTRGWRRILCLISWWNQLPEDEFFLTAVSYLCKLFPSLWIRNIHVSVQRSRFSSPFSISWPVQLSGEGSLEETSRTRTTACQMFKTDIQYTCS